MRWLLAFVIANLVVGGLVAQVPPAAVAPISASVPANPPVNAKEDVQDLVFRSNNGMLRFRLHVQVNGKSATGAWADFIDKVFAFYDRNNDKFLSPQEVARMPHPSAFGMGINLIFNGRGARGNLSFAEMDTNKDGKISPEEFRTYVLKSFGPVQVNTQPPQQTAQQLTDAFYKHVNKKGDGKLTRDELRAAWESLAKLDNDEDEIITAQELMGQPANPYAAFEVAQAYGMAQPQQQSSPFIALPVNATVAQQAEFLVSQFEREKSSPLPFGSLRGGETFPPFVRAALRQIELDDMTRWLNKPADLEMLVQLGNVAEGVGRLLSLGSEPAGVRVTKPQGKAAALDKVAKLGSDGVLRVGIDDAILEYNRGTSFDQFQGTAQYYLQQIKMLAGDKKYVVKKDLMDNNQLQFFANVFEDLDRDGDGKLTIAEVQAGFDLMSAGTKCQAVVTIVNQGRGLFTLIDTNHDNRLSRRELINAWKNFAQLDRNGDGVIERNELPVQFRITSSQGQYYTGPRFNQFGLIQQNQNSGPQKGPAWFRKMDRNRDGDVSAREFLGTPEEFKEIDTDGDGLISPQEAERYDTKRKAASK